MARKSTQTKSSLKRHFGLQWILANSLGYGAGVGLPILLADLLSAQRYTDYMVLAFVSLGFWVGLLQWLVLRQKYPLSMRWVWVSTSVPFLFLLFLTFFLKSSLILIGLLLVFVYPLIISLSQWSILRKIFQPAWGWLLLGPIAFVIGGVGGGGLGWLSHSWFNQPGLASLIGGLSWGLCYSVITSIGLRQLTQKKHLSPAKEATSSRDTPPDNNPWTGIISNLASLAVFGIWFLVLPPVPSASGNPFNTFIFLLVLFLYYYLSILVHELGHWLCAWVNKFELKYFAISRFVLVRTGQSFKFRRFRRLLAGGFVQAIPRSFDHLNRQLFWMMLGGPMASLLFFFVGATPYCFKP